MIDENFRISQKQKKKLLSKTEEFSKYLLVKFPELNETDITNLRQSIAGEVNE